MMITSRLMVRWLAVTALALWGTSAWADGHPPDDDRAPWRYRREVRLSVGGPGFAALPLPPEVLGHSLADLQDLRLVRESAEGFGEVPYVVDRQGGRTVLVQTQGELRDTRRERERTVLLIDLGAARTFDTVELTIPEKDFARRVTLEGALAAADGPFTTLRSDAGLFDQSFTPSRGGAPDRVHHTLIELAQPAVARYLRLTITDLRWPRFPHVEVTGVSVQRRRLLAEERWTRALALRPQPAPAPREREHGRAPSSYVIELPAGLSATTPIESLELEADDPSFRRRVTLWSRGPGNAAPQRLGDALVYRLPATDLSELGPLPQSEQRLLFPTDRGRGDTLLLEIDDGDSPPLHNPRLVATGVAVRLLLPLTGLSAREPLWAYYGNTRSHAPRYDLDELRERPPQRLSLATLGDESENSRYRATPPLAAVASLGGTLSSERWRFLRSLQVPSEGLFGAELQPTDLGVLQPDLRDLRIVSTSGAGEERQVPYVVSRLELPRPVRLALQAQPPPRPHVSRYRLVPPSPAPLWALELGVRERFFDRSLRLLTDPPAASGAQGGQAELRELYVGALRRGSADDVGAVTTPPLRLPLSGDVVSVLYLDIDEGDNAPLNVESVQGEALVPRLAFKAPPGRYQLLLGNPDAEAPRYDIAVLRLEVLAYDAEPLALGERLPNPGFRRRAADLLRPDGEGGGATVLLWIAIGAAVVVLLALTFKLAAAPPKKEGPQAGE